MCCCVANEIKEVKVSREDLICTLDTIWMCSFYESMNVPWLSLNPVTASWICLSGRISSLLMRSQTHFSLLPMPGSVKVWRRVLLKRSNDIQRRSVRSFSVFCFVIVCWKGQSSDGHDVQQSEEGEETQRGGEGGRDWAWFLSLTITLHMVR